jgi:hypothetical protein
MEQKRSICPKVIEQAIENGQPDQSLNKEEKKTRHADPLQPAFHVL